MLKFQEGLSQLGQDRPHVWLSRALESQLCSDLGIWGREAGIGVGNTGKAKGCSEVGVLTPPSISGPAGKIPVEEFNFLPLPTQLSEQRN